MRGRGEIDQRNLQLYRGAPNAQMQDRELLFEIRTEQHDRGGAVAVGDLGARNAEHELGGKPVADLGVDVVGADHALHQPGERVGVFVGAARAAEQRDRFGAVRVARAPDQRGGGIERVRPRDLLQLVADAPVRFDHAVVGVDPLDAVATLVAEPTVVHRLGIDTEQTDQPVRRRLHRAPALHRARVARGFDRVEIPRPGLEPVLPRGERAHRADLHGVAGEVRVERLLGEVQHLHVVAAVDEVDQRITGDLLGKPRAPAALDATLAVEEHEVAELDRLLEVALLLDEA